MNTLATQGFNSFLQLLLGSGVDQNTVNAIRAKVASLLSAGVDPKFSITPQGVQVENVLFPYQATGRSASTLRDPLLYVNAQLGIATTGRSQTSTQSGNEGQTIAQIAQEVTQSGFFQSTFGEVFANGFDLSCWGSSLSESKAIKYIEQDMPYLLQQSGVTSVININTVEKLFYSIEMYIHGMRNVQQPKYASCTRKGGKFGETLATEFKDYIEGAIIGQLSGLGKRLVKAGTYTKSNNKQPIASAWTNGMIGLHESYTFTRYMIETVQGQPDSSNSPGVGNLPSTPTPVTSTPNSPIFSDNGMRPPAKDEPTVSTANTSTIIGVIALAAGAYYMYEQKKGKTSKKSK